MSPGATNAAAKTAQGSYELSRFAVSADVELRRLNAQLDLFWDQEFELYSRLGLRDGLNVLDCGCGTGYLIQKLLAIFPSLRCTGIDYDPQLVAVARETLSDADCDRCSVAQGSVTELELPDDGFDFAVCRLVLEHLPDPSSAVHEVLRVLRPGGKAVFVSNDFDLHERTWPDTSALTELYDAYRRARRSDGGNPCIGREMPLAVRKAGFDAVQLHALVAHSSVVGDHAFLKAEGAGIPAQLVKTGFLAAASLDRVIDQWTAMLRSPEHAIMRILLAAVGQKPSQSSEGQRGPDSSAVPIESSRLHRQQQPAMVAPGAKLHLGCTPYQPEAITDFIRRTVAEELDVPPESIATSESLIRAGVDSIAAMGLCAKIESCFSVVLGVADVLCDSSIEDLAQKVLGLMDKGSQEEKPIARQPRSGKMNLYSGLLSLPQWVYAAAALAG